MPRVVLRGFLIVPEADFEAVRDELPAHIRATRDEPGCISFDVIPSGTDPCRFDVSAFDAHQRRVQASRWGEVSSGAERHYDVVEEPTTRPATIGDVLRTLLAISAILPGLLAGVLTLLTGGGRRPALNRATRMWGRQGTKAAGIRLRIEGAERLRLRPAIFTINHQSGIDPILICALLREDFVAVAKSEIRRNPVLGPAFAFVGTVFVDRGRGADPVEAMRPVVEACAQGLGLAMAPEGTRSEGRSVGRFKKGVAHVALATGVPLIPIVIHNAGEVLPRGGCIMRRGEVRVEVLEPIETSAWTPESLDTQVEALEQQYRRVLNVETF